MHINKADINNIKELINFLSHKIQVPVNELMNYYVHYVEIQSIMIILFTSLFYFGCIGLVIYSFKHIKKDENEFENKIWIYIGLLFISMFIFAILVSSISNLLSPHAMAINSIISQF